MTLQLPDTLTYGKVIGRFVLAVADVPEDPDALPNAVPAVGTISFTSMNPLTKETAATPPTTVVRSVIPAAIDNNGYLYNPKDPEGPRGIWLVAGPYKVAYSLNTGAIAGHDILVLPTHNDANPLDLINALPPGGPILTASQFAELTARMDILEAGGAAADPIAADLGAVSGAVELPTVHGQLVTLSASAATTLSLPEPADDGTMFALHIDDGYPDVTWDAALTVYGDPDEAPDGVWANVVRERGVWVVLVSEPPATGGGSEVQDTGLRNINSLVSDVVCYQSWGAATVRRIGNTVEVFLDLYPRTGATSILSGTMHYPLVIPAGFRPPGTNRRKSAAFDVPNNVGAHLLVAGAGAAGSGAGRVTWSPSNMPDAAMASVSATFFYYTDEPWPETLPGVPA